MDIQVISRFRYAATILLAVALSGLVITVVSFLARGILNLEAALTEKPDLAVYLLLPDEEISKTEILRERENERDYLVETNDGPKLVKLKKNESEWYVSVVEKLRE